MVTLSTLQELAEVVAEAGQQRLVNYVNAGFAAQQAAKRRGSKRTLGTRISRATARVLGLPEDTVSDNLARILDTSRDGAHIFLYEAFQPFLPPSAFRQGIDAEARDAAGKGRPEFDSALSFVRDDDQRAALRKRYLARATSSEKRKR